MEATMFFESLIQSHRGGLKQGIASVCSAHPFVLQAAMEAAHAHQAPVLIEATANQVNQDGGYTGMKPADFREFVYNVAAACSFPREQILLGGDHLGPHPWRKLPASEAMAQAIRLVEYYAAAGFSKIHLDTSMHLGGDDAASPLSDELIATRSAVLCEAAERAARQNGQPAPVYVVGSEVPPPGGPEVSEDEIHPTSTEAFLASYQAYARVFDRAGLEDAFSRVIAFVVQPGVEFIGDRVFDYNSENAKDLCAALKTVGRPLIFEGHSTDYQTTGALAQLRSDGVGILKVGPGLTFALREGLFALEAIEKEMLSGVARPRSEFSAVLEDVMLTDDQYWRSYYSGDAERLRLQRRYSYYDRARYYLGRSEVKASVELLLHNLTQTGIPEALLSQYLPLVYHKLRAGETDGAPLSILLGHVRCALDCYYAASKS